MTKQQNRAIGKIGEEIAKKHLINLGLSFLEENYSTKFGEIDLIMYQGLTLHFVEVKLKQGDFFGTPEEMIGVDKLGRVQRMAEYFLMENKNIKKQFEIYLIDAVCIVIDEKKNVERINFYENIGF